MQGEGMTCSAVTNQCSPQPTAFPEEHNSCANVIWMLSPSLCVRQGSLNLWLCFLHFEWEVCFSGPMQVILMISVLWCYVKHGVKDARQECWGGKRIRCTCFTASLPPFLITAPRAPPISLRLTANLWLLLNAGWAALHNTHHPLGTAL